MRSYLVLLLLVGLFLDVLVADEYRAIQRAPLSKLQKYKRVALVIGNDSYKVGKLSNAVNDARAIKEFLKSKKFKVIYAENATEKVMRYKVKTFLDSLDKKSIGFVYFSGHGIQEKSPKERRVVNYLIPTDNKRLQSITDLDYSAISLNYILDSLHEKGNNFNIVLLDACRTPFKAFSKSNQIGLSPTGAKGVFIAYATDIGERALDDGLFRKSFIKYASKPYKLVDIFESVKIDVNKKTGQTPYTSNRKVGWFYFTEPIEIEPSEPIVEEVVATQTPIIDPKIEEKKPKPTPVEKKYSLTISTTPSDAKITLMHIKPTYRDGMKLSKGKYKIKTTAKGYKKKIVTISLDRDIKMDMVLDKLPEIEKYSLSINTTPSNAKVYITNIKPKFRDGMKLKKGRYKIKVKAKGYKKSVVNIFLYKNISYDIVLKKEKKSKNIEKGTKNKKNTLTWEDRRSFGCKIDPTFCALTNDYEDITKRTQ